MTSHYIRARDSNRRPMDLKTRVLPTTPQCHSFPLPSPLNPLSLSHLLPSPPFRRGVGTKCIWNSTFIMYRQIFINSIKVIDSKESRITNNIVQSRYDFATNGSIPVKAYKNGANNIPGWNDVGSDKHKIAREAFLDWVYLGKPRQGAAFIYMKRKRASFKLALRYCRQQEEYLCADACAKELCNKNYRPFWNNISKMNNSKATKFAGNVGGASGEKDIANM